MKFREGRRPGTVTHLNRTWNMPACNVCKKTSEELGGPLQQCTKCKKRIFCGHECQIADWPQHKLNCGRVWYDKHRKCQDGYKHEGKLELITWNSVEEGDEKGWGNVVIEESDDMRKKFEEEFKGDEAKLYEYWPQAFRWTCCGTDAGMDWGCDHHGSGSRACTCDYCRSGRRLPDSIYNEQSASRMGLNLPRGPDPRSRRGF